MLIFGFYVYISLFTHVHVYMSVCRLVILLLGFQNGCGTT